MLNDAGPILPEASQPPIRRIFGAEPAPTWCYFYQKADLARQFGDWQHIFLLEEQAQTLGLSPNSAFEWLPFIEAHTQTEDWSGALALSLNAHQTTKRSAPALCILWQRFQNPGAEQYQTLQTALACTP